MQKLKLLDYSHPFNAINLLFKHFGQCSGKQKLGPSTVSLNIVKISSRKFGNVFLNIL